VLTDGGREINHLPLLLREDEGTRIVLEGHIARGNAVARIADGTELTAIFHGPEAYVSPTWYVSRGQVPTWNYAVVHVHGRFHPLDGEEVLAAMARLVGRFEGPAGWSMDRLDAADRDGMLKAIRYFRIEVDSVEAKLKLSQNRAPADRASVLERLDASPSDRHREMAAYFRAVNGE